MAWHFRQAALLCGFPVTPIRAANSRAAGEPRDAYACACFVPRHWLNWAPYTYLFNLSLHPAASVPCGFTRDGRPVGLQIVGPYLREDVVLRAARAYEQAHPWRFLADPRET